MNKPSGKDILNSLVKLLAMQESVKITFEIVESGKEEQR